MRANSIEVDKFAKDEYPGLVAEGLDGEDLLVKGQNRTGKTLSLNAILYNILGSSETIKLATGRGNSVEVSYTNGFTFHRGQPEAKYNDGHDTLTAESARKKFADYICSKRDEKIPWKEAIKSHFLHSRTGRLPLLEYTDNDLIRLIRTITDSRKQEKVEYHRVAVQQIEERIADLERKKKDKENDLGEIKSELSNDKSQLKKWEKLRSLSESGQLQDMKEGLESEQSLKDELSEVFKQIEGIRQQLRTIRKNKRKWENYKDEETIQVIADAVEDFVCPACEGQIDSGRAKSRTKRGRCPFCASKSGVSDLKSEIREQIEISTDRLEQLEREEKEKQEEKSELESEAEELKSQIPDVGEIDPFVERKLRKYEEDLTALDDAISESVTTLQSEIEREESQKEYLESDLEEIESRLEAINKSQQIAEDSLESAEMSTGELTDTFQEKLSDNYSDVADDLSLNVQITEEGKVVLPGNTDDRLLDQDGDFSDAEVRLLNIAFAKTVNEFAKESGLIEWDIIVVDEPFTYLDEESTDNLIEFIKSSDQQFIVTSSEEGLDPYFDNIEKLKKNDIQATFQRYN